MAYFSIYLKPYDKRSKEKSYRELEDRIIQYPKVQLFSKLYWIIEAPHDKVSLIKSDLIPYIKKNDLLIVRTMSDDSGLVDSLNNWIMKNGKWVKKTNK